MEWLSFASAQSQVSTFHYIKYIGSGVFVTLKYSIISVFFGLIIGLLLTIANNSKNPLIYGFSKLYVSIFRGTPLLVQLSIIYFGLPVISGLKLSILTAGILSFSLNSGAYISQIIQSGVNSIDVGQFEAAKSLGISNFAMMKDIVLPQAIRNILPALINEVVNMFKETAIVSILGEQDIMFRANMIAGQTYDYFTPLIIAAACYYILVLSFSGIAKYIEKRCML